MKREGRKGRRKEEGEREGRKGVKREGRKGRRKEGGRGGKGEGKREGERKERGHSFLQCLSERSGNEGLA